MDQLRNFSIKPFLRIIFNSNFLACKLFLQNWITILFLKRAPAHTPSDKFAYRLCPGSLYTDYKFRMFSILTLISHVVGLFCFCVIFLTLNHDNKLRSIWTCYQSSPTRRIILSNYINLLIYLFASLFI